MYKLLLIWRYLLTRRIAYASVISVTLGVASMIVVNAVMLGFSREMQDRIHGALSDVTIRSQSSLAGFEDVDARIRDVHKIAGDMVEAVTPTVTTPGLMSYDFGGGEVVSRQVQIVGIDTATNEKVTALSQYLQHPENRRQLSFELREGGYDVQNPNFGDSG
ncbi:MAG: ABC transporter permease, partial [Thermoguttaceae bacterium]|nr:ABC transporter permease [Thermoguttaceae bacterium]